ncbi:dTDP-glucose 4,6-dehydratase, partial [bacterium]|nr:dTDP-glucose 4,6-dehydratase [bacterium]
QALDLILEKAKPGSIYNIGGNNERSNLDITAYILDFLGKPADLITHVEDRKAHDRRYAIDASLIKQDLGWEPTVPFEKGIQMTFDWYKDNQNWVNQVIQD